MNEQEYKRRRERDNRRRRRNGDEEIEPAGVKTLGEFSQQPRQSLLGYRTGVEERAAEAAKRAVSDNSFNREAQVAQRLHREASGKEAALNYGIPNYTFAAETPREMINNVRISEYEVPNARIEAHAALHPELRAEIESANRLFDASEPNLLTRYGALEKGENRFERGEIGWAKAKGEVAQRAASKLSEAVPRYWGLTSDSPYKGDAMPSTAKMLANYPHPILNAQDQIRDVAFTVKSGELVDNAVGQVKALPETIRTAAVNSGKNLDKVLDIGTAEMGIGAAIGTATGLTGVKESNSLAKNAGNVALEAGVGAGVGKGIALLSKLPAVGALSSPAVLGAGIGAAEIAKGASEVNKTSDYQQSAENADITGEEFQTATQRSVLGQVANNIGSFISSVGQGFNTMTNQLTDIMQESGTVEAGDQIVNKYNN